jgi:biopolymer transport protein ExbB
MWELFIKGGPLMYVLFVCSFWGLYIVVDKLLFLRANSLDFNIVSARLKKQLATSGKANTVRDLRTRRDLAYKVVSQAIKLADLPREEIQDGVKEITQFEVYKMEKNLNILSSIITVAPIVGLLGTVLGLMDIFQVISGGALGDASALSGGIAEALITTVTGLGISVPFIFLFQYISHRIDELMLSIEHFVNDILRYVRSSREVQP